MKLRNDKILILGGGSGIGKAIAKRFCDDGATVLITGRNEEKLKAAAEEIGGNIHYAVFDITDIAAHTDFFNKAEEIMGGLNGFVNSAALGCGTLGRGYEPFDITPEEWDLLNDTNYKAAFFLIRNEINFLKGKGVKGNILNISSNAACMDIHGSYGAAKLAMLRWTKTIGKKVGKFGIIMNGIAPGSVFTPMIAEYAKDINQKFDRHAIGRFIRPDEIAELAYYLMSDYGEIVCGHTVVADGGDQFSGF